jgi:hypothetical protein
MQADFAEITSPTSTDFRFEIPPNEPPVARSTSKDGHLTTIKERRRNNFPDRVAGVEFEKLLRLRS